MSARLRPLLPVVGSVAAASALVALAVALPGGGVSAFLVRLAEGVLAGGAVPPRRRGCWADRRHTAEPLAAPRSDARVRADRAGHGLGGHPAAAPLAGHPAALGVLTGELVVLVALAVALAAVLVWRGDPAPGSRVAPTLGIAGISALLAEPLLRATIFLPADGAGDLSGWVAWSAAGLLAVAVILLASRDPASRWRR